MKRNKINLIAILTMGAALFACSSGGSSSGSSTPVMGFQGGEYGPITVNMYDNLLAGKIKPSNLDSKSLKGAGAAADTAAATGVMAAVFPPAAVVLGPISAISGLVAADQVAAQINQINNELNYQESQIQQIYGILDASYNYLVDKAQVNYVSNLESSYANWINILVAPSFFYGYGQTQYQVSPLGADIVAYYQGYVSSFMSSAPSGSTNTINQNVTNLLTNVATESTTMNNIATTISNYTTTYDFQKALTGASMTVTKTPNNQSILIESTTTTETYNSTYLLLVNAQQALQSAIPTVDNPDPEFVALAESYNYFVNSVYLTNVSVLQAMYTMEATNNYLNYINYMATESGGQLTQICPLEGVSGDSNAIQNTVRFYVTGSTGDIDSGCPSTVSTVYYPGNSYTESSINQYQSLNYSNAESAFIFAQQQLTQLYARRINMLYQLTMPFIYSDHGYPNQGINLVNNESSLSSNMESIIASTAQLKLIESNIPGVAMVGGNWTKSSNLYQYPITNLDASRQNISNGVEKQINVNPYTFPVIPKINDTNYPTVYQNIQIGYYDGESISVYNGSLSVTSPANPFNFAEYCWVNSIGDYQAVESGLSAISGAIFCNNWSGSVMANNTTLSANLNIESVPNMESVLYTPASINYGGTIYGYYSPTQYAYYMEEIPVYFLPISFTGSYNQWFRMANKNNDSYTYYVATSSQSNNFTLLASSNSTPGFNLGSGEFYTSGSGTSFALQDGGFGGSIFTHSALLQVTLPNGYNLPIYIYTYVPTNTDGSPSYSSPVCPASLGVTVPGIKSCSQQSAGNGGLQIETTDNSVYYLNVLQPSDGQGMQYGYFQVNTTPQTACNSNNPCTQ